MEIIIASDHAGVELKEKIKAFLCEKGIQIRDVGTDSSEPVDYPDYGKLVASAVSGGAYERGILICGTGIGMSVIANRQRGVQATLCHDIYTAKMSRLHNNSNILVLGGRVQFSDDVHDIVGAWLDTKFLGGEHLRRLEKIEQFEEDAQPQDSSASNPASASRRT